MSTRVMATASLVLSLALGSLALACAFDARGQDGSGPPDFPTRPVSALSSDQAEAAELISRSGQPALFKNVTDHQGPAVLHLASGMTCRFAAGARANTLAAYSAQADREDVGCSTTVDGVHLTHYAYRYPDLADAETELRHAVAAMIQALPDLRDYEGQIAVASADEVELSVIYRARGAVDMNGHPVMTKAMTSQVGGWMLKQRMTVRLEDALHGDLWSELQFLRLVFEVTDHLAEEGR